jgi:hypothetical protein
LLDMRAWSLIARLPQLASGTQTASRAQHCLGAKSLVACKMSASTGHNGARTPRKQRSWRSKKDSTRREMQTLPNCPLGCHTLEISTALAVSHQIETIFDSRSRGASSQAKYWHQPNDTTKTTREHELQPAAAKVCISQEQKRDPKRKAPVKNDTPGPQQLPLRADAKCSSMIVGS